MFNKAESFAVSAIILTVLVVLIFGFAHMTKCTLDITVVSKERVVKGESSKYMIFAKGEVFENTDSFAMFKWNSSDIYNKLEPGKTYNVLVYGWRVPFFSWYRNIVEAYPVKGGDNDV